MSQEKYDVIGAGYDSTRRADPYITDRLFHYLSPSSDRLYLDIGCGTGNYTIALANKGFQFVGVEPSEKMLTVAQKRNTSITWLSGTAEQIPSETNVFDGAIATLTMHHWADLEKAFKEISRVLTNHGILLLFTSTPEQMKGYWLNHYFPSMLHNSMLQMPSLERLLNVSSSAGIEMELIEKYYVRAEQEDHFLYVGKNRPELYFDEVVRNGISSFSSLANKTEVEMGLARLKDDLEHHRFEDIRDTYENDRGDYMFIMFSNNPSALQAF